MLFLLFLHEFPLSPNSQAPPGSAECAEGKRELWARMPRWHVGPGVIDAYCCLASECLPLRTGWAREIRWTCCPILWFAAVAWYIYLMAAVLSARFASTIVVNVPKMPQLRCAPQSMLLGSCHWPTLKFFWFQPRAEPCPFLKFAYPCLLFLSPLWQMILNSSIESANDELRWLVLVICSHGRTSNQLKWSISDGETRGVPTVMCWWFLAAVPAVCFCCPRGTHGAFFGDHPKVRYQTAGLYVFTGRILHLRVLSRHYTICLTMLQWEPCSITSQIATVVHICLALSTTMIPWTLPLFIQLLVFHVSLQVSFSCSFVFLNHFWVSVVTCWWCGQSLAYQCLLLLWAIPLSSRV